MGEQIPQNSQTYLLRAHTFVRQENLGFSREKYRLTMHALTVGLLLVKHLDQGAIDQEGELVQTARAARLHPVCYK